MKHLIRLILLVSLISYIQTTLIFQTDNSTYEGSECENSYSVRGICKSISECNSGHQFIRKRDLCAFSKDIPLYCCPNSIENVKKNGTNAKIGGDIVMEYIESLRPNTKICQYYMDINGPEKRIIFGGGRKTLEREQSHMVAIGWKRGETVDFRCGGSIVTTNFVLTAAHCTSLQSIQPNIVRAGEINLRIPGYMSISSPKDYNITNVYIHPNYTGRNYYHDIALLQIAPDFETSDHIFPACIWDSYEIPVENLTAMGFGTRSFGGPQSNELYQGDLRYQQHEECVKNIPVSSDIPKGIIREQICAHSPNADTCQADSGGPLQFRGSTLAYIVGVTSFGINCLGNTPGVYTRVSEYVNWIESILRPNFHPVRTID